MIAAFTVSSIYQPDPGAGEKVDKKKTCLFSRGPEEFLYALYLREANSTVLD